MGIPIYDVCQKYFDARTDENIHRQQYESTVVFQCEQAVTKLTSLKVEESKQAKDQATYGVEDVAPKNVLFKRIK